MITHLELDVVQYVGIISMVLNVHNQNRYKMDSCLLHLLQNGEI